MRGRDPRRVLAAETWRRLFDFFVSTRAQRDDVLRRLGLTPNDARALSSLAGRAGRTMRSLAEEWGCDASNATWIVDRLERAGLAQRGPHASDRRVKLVRLTPRGAGVRTRLRRAMHEPPPELLALDPESLGALRDLLQRLPPRRRAPAVGGRARRGPTTR